MTFRPVWLAPIWATILLPASALAADSIKLEVAAGGEKPVGSITPKLSAELALKGSRGETLNFVLKASGLKGCQPYGASPWAPGPAPSAPSVRLYTMPTMDITHPSFPHAAQGKLYDPLLPAPNSCAEEGWMWGELEIPEDLKPGQYESSLRVGTSKLPIHLTVWKMKMPTTPSLPAYSELSSWNLLLAHYGAWHSGEETLRGKYLEEMKKHRIYPVKSFIAVPPLLSKGDHPTLDLDNAPTREQSFQHNNVKTTPKELYLDFPTIMPPEIDKPETVTYFKAIQNMLGPLKRTGKALVYLWDEPKPEEMPNLLKLAKIAKTNAPGLKVLVTTTPKAELNPYVDIYVPVMDQYDVRGFPDAATYKKLQKEGKEFWMYVSCMSHGCDALMDSGRPDMVIERPSAWIRSIGWLGMRFGLNAFLYYALVDGFQKSPTRDPWKDLWDFSGNGDGTLFYPGRPGEHGFKEHGPVTSIRLKLWRESSFDAEYIHWMEALPNKPAWWTTEFEALTQSSTKWEHDYSKYSALREKAGEFLSKQ